MKHLIIFFVFAFGTFGAFGQAKKDTIRIKTSSICEMCKKTIEKDLAFEKGVMYSNLDLSDNVVTVVYKPKQTDPLTIKRRLNEIGYDADSLKAYPIAVERLPECCKPGNPFHSEDEEH